MLKIKKIFPSRNYITIDTYGDVEIIFNPSGNGFQGEDSLRFRKGRWAFRINDFLSGKVLPNGESEKMNRKIYNINIVYDDEDGEPLISTSYIDPTSVIPLDGSLVTLNGINTLAQELTAVQCANNLISVNDKIDIIENRLESISLRVDRLARRLQETEARYLFDVIDEDTWYYAEIPSVSLTLSYVYGGESGTSVFRVYGKGLIYRTSSDMITFQGKVVCDNGVGICINADFALMRFEQGLSTIDDVGFVSSIKGRLSGSPSLGSLRFLVREM